MKRILWINSADGQEVIATIVKEMEDRREDLIVIFAGYDREMRQFLDTNPGLRSRIKYDLWFGNYTINDLSEIFRISANKKGFVVSAELDSVFRDRIEKEMHAKDLVMQELFVHYWKRLLTGMQLM